MRAIVDLENDMILSWGRLYNEPQYHEKTVEIPDDYDPDVYDYIPAVSGVFDPNGFIRKPIEEQST